MSPKQFSAKRRICATLAPAVMLLCAHVSPAGPASEDDIPSGPIGLKELVAIGLKNDRKLIALRGEITIAEAKKIAEKDWRDPELRIARAWDNDVELPPSFDERRVEQRTDRATTTDTNAKGKTSVERGKTTTTETTDLHVTPKADRTIIRESTTRSESTRINGPDGPETQTEIFQRNAYQERSGGLDPLARDDDYSFRLRFYPPHPWQRKARLERAQARIELARAELHTAEREVVAWVRKKYEELQYLKSMVAATRQRVAADKSFAEDMNTLMENGATTRDKVGFAKMDSITSSLAADDAQVAYENELGELAATLGIISTSRIHVSSHIARPTISMDSGDLEYLIQMAFANRGELREIISSGQISEGNLAMAKADYIPWFSYVQMNYGIENRGGQQRGDNYGFQVGVTLPFFTWLGHQKAIHEAAVESLYSQMGAARQQITAQVTEAYRALRRTAGLKARAGANLTSMGAELDEAANFALDSVDSRKLKYEADKRKIDLSEALLSAHRHYNEALIRFEEALGADVNEVFNSKGLEASAAPMMKAPKAAENKTAKKAKPSTPKEKKSAPKPAPEAEAKARPEPEPEPEKKKKFQLFKRSGSAKKPTSRRLFGRKRP